MNKVLMIAIFGFLIFSCTSKEDNYLNKGLTELKNVATLNKDFIKGFTIKKLGVIKIEDQKNEYKLVFLLNNDVKKEVVENYSVTIRAVPEEKEKMFHEHTKNEYLWDFKPILVEKNGHNYMIKSVKTNIQRLKELRFALYHRQGYKGKTLSKVISVRNFSMY